MIGREMDIESCDDLLNVIAHPLPLVKSNFMTYSCQHPIVN
jgi:hypothetical protein